MSLQTPGNRELKLSIAKICSNSLSKIEPLWALEKLFNIVLHIVAKYEFFGSQIILISYTSFSLYTGMFNTRFSDISIKSRRHKYCGTVRLSWSSTLVESDSTQCFGPESQNLYFIPLYRVGLHAEIKRAV